MQEFGIVTLASFRLCECYLFVRSRTKRVVASWLSMMWTIDDLCVLETPNIVSCFFVAVSPIIIGWAASWVTALNFHADAMTF